MFWKNGSCENSIAWPIYLWDVSLQYMYITMSSHNLIFHRDSAFGFLKICIVSSLFYNREQDCLMYSFMDEN